MAKAAIVIKSLARSHTEKAINGLVGILSQSKAPPAARVAAAKTKLPDANGLSAGATDAQRSSGA